MERDWPMTFVLSGIVIGIVALFYLAYEQEKEWLEFKVEHACKVVAKESSTLSTVWTTSANGSLNIGTVTTPSKVGYLCNDGITYWR